MYTPTTKLTNVPKWLNLKAVVEAAKDTLEKSTSPGMQKTASTHIVVLSYRDSKGHVVSAEDAAIVSQLQKGATTLYDAFGKELIPHKQITVYEKPENRHIQSEANVTQIDQRERQLHPSYMVDSTINRHLQYKALQRLTDLAASSGMFSARAVYVNGRNAAVAGKQFQGYKEIDAKIEFLVAPRLKKFVTATIGIDVGGKFVLPKIFKTADGKEYSFDKEGVASLLQGMQYEKPLRDTRKRSDVPVFKRPDPTRFNQVL